MVVLSALLFLGGIVLLVYSVEEIDLADALEPAVGPQVYGFDRLGMKFRDAA